MKQKFFNFIEQYIQLSEIEKSAILALGIFKSFKKDTILLREGQYSTDSYFVLNGCIRTYYTIDGEEKTTAFYTEMEPFFRLCTIHDQPSEYYIACVEDSILVMVNSEAEKQIFEEFPRFKSLCRLLTAQLFTKIQIDLDDFKISSPEQRYINLLNNRPDLLQRVPQHQIASYLGMKPQSLSRIKKRLNTAAIS